MSALLSWLWGLVPLDKAAIAGCAVLALLAGWFYIASSDAEADAAMLRADNTRLTDAVAAKDAAMAVLERDRAAMEAVFVRQSLRASILDTAATDAAQAIQGAANDGQGCDIDAELPRALSGPVYRVCASAKRGDRAPGDIPDASGDAVPAEAHAGTAGDDDRPQSGAVGHATGGLGSRDER